LVRKTGIRVPPASSKSILKGAGIVPYSDQAAENYKQQVEKAAIKSRGWICYLLYHYPEVNRINFLMIRNLAGCSCFIVALMAITTRNRASILVTLAIMVFAAFCHKTSKMQSELSTLGWKNTSIYSDLINPLHPQVPKLISRITDQLSSEVYPDATFRLHQFENAPLLEVIFSYPDHCESAYIFGWTPGYVLGEVEGKLLPIPELQL
jgi:hypothetical protein